MICGNWIGNLTKFDQLGFTKCDHKANLESEIKQNKLMVGNLISGVTNRAIRSSCMKSADLVSNLSLFIRMCLMNGNYIFLSSWVYQIIYICLVI